MELLRLRAGRHPLITGVIWFFFGSWLLLFSLSSWIDLFQGFELTRVITGWLQGATVGLVILVAILGPLWFLLTAIAERVFGVGVASGPLDRVLQDEKSADWAEPFEGIRR